MEQFKPENNPEIQEQPHIEELETKKLSAGQLFTAISQVERADEILLHGLDFNIGEFENIKEYLIKISDPLFTSLLVEIRNETNSPKDRLKHVEILEKLEIILGIDKFQDLLKNNITNRETLVEIKRKLKSGGRWWNKLKF